MRTTYCFLGLRDIPPLEETRHKMMTYLLDRHDNTRDSLHIMTSCLFSIHLSRYPGPTSMLVSVLRRAW